MRFYSIWNESNLQLFLTPQFDAKGKSVAPRNYAKLAAAAYSGIKAGNSGAKVAIGEHVLRRPRQAAGRQVGDPLARPLRTARGGCQPAPEVRRLGAAPVSGARRMPPTQKVKWPNVTLASFSRFEASLDKWFKRKNVRIWITEYGHEVKQDGEPNGISRAQQAAYAAQALALAKKDPRTDMFIWFVFRDHKTSEWQSGLRTTTGAAKPSLSRFAAAARSVDARNALFTVKGGVISPTVRVALRAYATGTKPGENVGFNLKVFDKAKLVTKAQSNGPFGRDATAPVRITGFRPVKGKTYTVRVEANVFSGGGVVLKRTLTLVAR